MSHGPAASGSAAEPNLTPLLDMVLQLLMFFVICADMKRADRKNPAVDLPPSQSAVPRSPGDKDVISVNLRAYREKDYAHVLGPKEMDEVKLLFRDAYAPSSPERPNQQVPSLVVPRRNSEIGKEAGLNTPMNMTQFGLWLKSEVDLNKTQNEAGLKKDKNFKPVELVINIRAEEGIAYEHVYKICEICQQNSIKSVTVSVKTINRGG